MCFDLLVTVWPTEHRDDLCFCHAGMELRKLRLQAAHIGIAQLHFQHLVEIAIEDLSRPTHVDRVVADQAVQRKGWDSNPCD